MSIHTEAKFNSGSGGVSVVITNDVEGGQVRASELLSPRKAIDLALQLIHKAVIKVPDELDAAIRNLKSQKGMW